MAPGTAGEWGRLAQIGWLTLAEALSAKHGWGCAPGFVCRCQPGQQALIAVGPAMLSGNAKTAVVGAVAAAHDVLHVSLLCVVENLSRLSRGSGYRPLAKPVQASPRVVGLLLRTGCALLMTISAL